MLNITFKISAFISGSIICYAINSILALFIPLIFNKGARRFDRATKLYFDVIIMIFVKILCLS